MSSHAFQSQKILCLFLLNQDDGLFRSLEEKGGGGFEDK
jgi:hypothetical protein